MTSSDDVECPECGHAAPFEAFTRAGKCPGCRTFLTTLFDSARGTA